MIVVGAHFVPTSLGGFFYDDQAAIAHGASADGELYAGSPRTPGFAAVRVPAAALSVGLVLDEGATVWGDGMSVQYAGAAGRHPVFDPPAVAPRLQRELGPRLQGVDVTSFRGAEAAVMSMLSELGLDHPAIEYGLSQALLGASAAATSRTMAEVIADEYGLELVPRRIPIYAQSGDRRHGNADKMILKRVGILPHGLFNAEAKVGRHGEVLLEYVRWLAGRVLAVGPPAYRPVIHLDVYGRLGAIFDASVPRVVEYLRRLAGAAEPLRLRVESPIDFGSRTGQIEGMAELRRALDDAGAGVETVADEWCNSLEDVEAFAAAGSGHLLQVKVPDLGSLARSIEAVRGCRGTSVAPILGGSCTETDLSARACVHVALATRPDCQLAKPGMGVDEGLLIVHNEQERLFAQLWGS